MIQEIPIKNIRVLNPKTNWDEESFNQLKESIRVRQLHPITVQRLPYDGESDKYELSAGESRLRAKIELGHSTIEALVLGPEMSPDQILEVHLDENLIRNNLTWYDIAELELKRHQLRMKQNGLDASRSRGNSAEKGQEATSWGMRETAKELGIGLGTLSEDIKLATAVINNPQLKNIKDRRTALQVVRSITRREEKRIEAQAPDEFDYNQILLGDSLEVLKHIPSNTFDVCITDPPWLEFKDDRLIRDSSTIPVFQEVYRVLKRDALCYIILGLTDFPAYQAELPKIGFQLQKWPLIWAKSGTITHGRRQWEYARDFELILLCAKGSPVLTTNTENSAVFNFPAVPAMKLVHPNEKPLDLIKKIINQAVFDGGSVLDPFAGSGAVLKASQEMGRRWFGIERDQEFFKKIERRMLVSK